MKKRRRPSKPPTFALDDWRLVERIGRGGNGEVWLAENGSGAQMAIKFLKAQHRKRRLRFLSEAQVLAGLGARRGIIPLVKRHLKEAEPDGMWYAMPVAEGNTDELRGHLLESASAIAEVSEVLVGLHARDIFHRDIKPANILKWRNEWCLTDFGLVDAPSTPDLTKDNEEVGAKWTIAPEMRRRARESSGGPADVYSIAKTLWILATGSTTGFDGTYSRETVEQSLSKRCKNQYVGPLEDLLEDATSYDPSSRPTIAQFLERLREWLTSRSDFKVACRAEWVSLQRRLFPRYRPERARWRERDSIIKILNVIGGPRRINHTFIPTGGGLDLEGAVANDREDCVEMFLGSREVPSLVRPAFLELVFFDSNPEWSYFWLETSEMKPTGLYEDPGDCEEYVELPDGRLLERGHWDENGYNEGDSWTSLPESARLVVRHLRGPFVIVAKSSPYNQTPETYDARHAKMSSDEFFDYMRKNCQRPLPWA